MANLKDLAKSRAALLNFDPRLLKVKQGLNARNLDTPDNREHVEWLAASIAQEGVKNPLVVFTEGDDVFVADGHCRLAATLLAIDRGADIVTVPCVPESRGTNDVDRVLAQNIYNSGKQLSPIEQGVNFKKAIALGASTAQISGRVGKSIGYINQMISFQSAPVEVHRLVSDGAVSATLAAKVIREDGATKGLEKIKKAVDTAKEAGKTRATAKHVAAPQPTTVPTTDAQWSKLVAFVRAHTERPDDVTNTDIKSALVLIGG